MKLNEAGSRGCNGGAVAFGFALVAIGAVLLMDDLEIVSVRLFDLWPVALIAIGVEGLLNPRRRVKN